MSKEVSEFVKTIKVLRDPDNGCPWDLEQTHESLKRYMLEESYECLEAIDEVAELENKALEDATKEGSNKEQALEKRKLIKEKLAGNEEYAKAVKNLKEELGDLMLQILLHSQIADDNGNFDLEAVAKLCNDKMRSRHPHVFDDSVAKAENVDDVHKNWDAAKAKEKDKAKRSSVFDGIPSEMPALHRAWKISKKAVKESFEWDTENQLWEQLESEINELKEAIENDKKSSSPKTREDIELELGDVLFTAVNIGRWNKIDPEDCLRKTNNKFIKRFNKMMEIAKEQTQSEAKNIDNGKVLSAFSSDELLELWQKAKLALAKS